MVELTAMACLIVCLLLVIFEPVLTARIVMLHMYGGSHQLTAGVIGNELARRGHEVTIITPGAKEAVKKPMFKKIFFHPGFPDEHMSTLFHLLSRVHAEGFRVEVKAVSQFIDTLSTICSNLVARRENAEAIAKADLLIVELNIACGPVIAEKFQKPFVSYLPNSVASFMASAFRIPLNPSYVPSFKTEYTDIMRFHERLSNFLITKLFDLVFPIFVNWRMQPFKEVMNISINHDIFNKASDSKLMLGNCNFAIDYPFPLMPNTFCVGPFIVEPANPLPEKLQAFVDTPKGFILAAFGTYLKIFDKRRIETMARAFGELDQRVIWQLRDSHDIKMPENVLILKWVPQNDLLGHPNIRLFISHTGISSMHEAIYHGVPVLATPSAFDQWTNAFLLKNRLKMAEVMDVETVSKEEFFKAVKLVISRKSYKENAKKVSHRLRTQKHTPMQRAGDLIEYVIDNKYDVSHLRPRALDIPWYIHDLWDIYIAIISVTLLTSVVFYVSVKLLWKFFFTKKIKRE